jgi:predicted AlkP superfamily pyrophosphatase or phosphodiesterase
MWWNPLESGWGIDVAHQGDVIFATWFTHDANGKAWYLSMTAAKTGLDTYSGTLYRTSGPPLDAVRFDAARVQRVEVGTGTLSFSDANNGNA